jgi:glutaredoxin-like protein
MIGVFDVSQGVTFMEKYLEQSLQEDLKKIFANLVHPVKIIYFSTKDKCAYCTEISELLGEVTDLSEKLLLETHDINEENHLAKRYDVSEAPVFIITGMDGERELDYRIRFYGMPGGHEFTSLINDLLIVSHQDSGLQPETRQFLASLKQPVHLQVFVTPTCPYCPQAVVLAHQMALESTRVTADMIEAIEFPDLANHFNVSGVPHTAINLGAGTVIGGVPEEALVSEIRKSLAV